MCKAGDKVIITGRQFAGQKGVIIKPDKLAVPGEPQESGWLVQLKSGVKYKFYSKQLKIDESA